MIAIPLSNTPLLFVDAGYLLHYRWHATQRWMSFQKETAFTNPTAHTVWECFEKHLKSQIETLWKKNKLGKYGREHTIFCMDSPLTKVWRKHIEPTYKDGRASGALDTAHSLGMSDLFVRYEALLREIGHVLKYNGLEADDLIAIAVQKIRAADPHRKIIIITSDHDFLQLKDEYISLINGSGKELKGCHENAEVCMWVKIFMGDKSDNIPAAIPKCGPRTALKLAEDHQKREEAIQKYRDRVERNQLLIDFTKIPKSYIDAVEALLAFSKI